MRTRKFLAVTATTLAVAGGAAATAPAASAEAPCVSLNNCGETEPMGQGEINCYKGAAVGGTAGALTGGAYKALIGGIAGCVSKII